jgi:hypothetical protein
MFLLIHLSAPALANLGGSILSSNTMVRTYQSEVLFLSEETIANIGLYILIFQLLDREYYQTSFAEIKCNFAVSTSDTVRDTRRVRHHPERIFAPASHWQQPRKLTSLLTLAAYSSLVFLPIHVFTHRLATTVDDVGCLAGGW